MGPRSRPRAASWGSTRSRPWSTSADSRHRTASASLPAATATVTSPRVARRLLPEGALGYLGGGGEDEYTLRRNRGAFDTFELVPQVLRDDVDTSTPLLGRSRYPICVAAVA
jgi:hypothetical protein